PSTLPARHTRRAQAWLARELQDARRRRPRIGGAEIADDPDLVPQAAREHGSDEPIERGIEAASWIAATLELRQREGALGQRFEHQKARPREPRQRINHRTGGIRPVAGK